MISSTRFKFSLFYLVIVFALLSLMACVSKKNEEPCPECFTPPQGISIRLTDKSGMTDLLYTNVYNKDSLKLTYLQNNVEKELKLNAYKDTVLKQMIISSSEMGWVSAGGIKKFSLKLNYQKGVKLEFSSEEIHRQCCTSFHIASFKSDGIELIAEQSTIYKEVFPIRIN